MNCVVFLVIFLSHTSFLKIHLLTAVLFINYKRVRHFIFGESECLSVCMDGSRSYNKVNFTILGYCGSWLKLGASCCLPLYYIGQVNHCILCRQLIITVWMGHSHKLCLSTIQLDKVFNVHKALQ